MGDLVTIVAILLHFSCTDCVKPLFRQVEKPIYLLISCSSFGVIIFRVELRHIFYPEPEWIHHVSFGWGLGCGKNGLVLAVGRYPSESTLRIHVSIAMLYEYIV